MSNKFKVGDKVACYWYSDELVRSVGTIVSIKGDELKVAMAEDDEFFKQNSTVTWNAFQCRRLVKSPGQRVWIKNSPYINNVSYTPIEGWIEYKKVKK